MAVAAKCTPSIEASPSSKLAEGRAYLGSIYPSKTGKGADSVCRVRVECRVPSRLRFECLAT